MMRACPLIASGILIACQSLFGQNSAAGEDPREVIKTSENGLGAEHGICTSGFDIFNGGRNPDDLGHYPDQILAKVRSKWYPQIPELQKSIGRKPSITVIDFEIKHDGSLGKVTTVESAGNASLDAAASLAILWSAPFVLHYVGNGVTPPKATYSPDPEYAEKARSDKYMSIVRIAGTVDLQGAFTDLCVAQAAGEGLDEKALEAVAAWKFEPATLRGEPVAVRLNVEVSFRLY